MATPATLSDVHKLALRSLLVVREGLERLERLESSSSASTSSYYGSSGAGSPSASIDAATDLAHHIKLELNQLHNYSCEMDRLWRLEGTKGQRDLWKRKIEQVAEEVDSSRIGLEKHLSQQHRRQADAQLRAELFQRTNGDAATILDLYDIEAQVKESVQTSSRLLEDITNTGIAVLGKYAEQRERLKAAQRKALDVMNTVGLSNSLLRVIDRRLLTDRWIAYVGMVVTVAIIIVVIYWTR